jgi:hypothetical protein
MTPKRLSRGHDYPNPGLTGSPVFEIGRVPMSQATRTTGARYTIFILALAGAAICSVSGANGGDLGAPGYGPYPYGTLIEGGGICRTLHERRVDVYGRETVHRIRICDEGPVYSGPDWSVAPQEYVYPQRRFYEPAPSQFYSYPRSPAPIGPAYYN